MREISNRRALLNLAGAALLVMLAGWGATQVAQRHWHWQPTFHARAEFPRIGGLAVGDKVRLQGMDAGVVEAIEPPKTPGGPIGVRLRLDSKLRALIRSDAVASVSSPSVVGPKVVEIAPGRPDAPPLPDGANLHTTAPVELSDLLESAQTAFARLESVSREAEFGLTQISGIAESINKGEGTLGKLVRDDDAYNQVMSLAERGEKAVGVLGDNLSVIRGIWPLSSAVKDRGYDELERLLYRPNSTRESKVFASEQMFRPESAILTDTGKSQLDGFSQWFKARRWSESTEVAIVAFTDSPSDAEAARILTEDQAKAVKTYLEEKHKLFEIPVFRQRKVAAVGFGTKRPKPDPASAGVPDDTPLPDRRVEVVLFTPRS